ncbi:hypothetical protein GE061_019712 [Apolygus lucorum]|uniref:Uncharacterized protein n=1 Tax=Apolygus lucorum TaxID=248454 RepID=A0A8S9XAE3_APOLU|nr:hypothetical protein GE061_019712 [Apolygus lucorum]
MNSVSQYYLQLCWQLLKRIHHIKHQQPNNMNTSSLIALCAFVGVAVSEAAGGWGGNSRSGVQGGGQGGQWGNQGGNQGGSSWGQQGQAGGSGAWGQQGQAGGQGADSRSLFGPDGKRYGANLIDTPDMWGYEANIPGATSRFVGYRSANGRSGFGQDGSSGRSGQNRAYGPQGGKQGGQQGWGGQQGGQQGWGGQQGGQQGWGGQQGGQSSQRNSQQGGQQGWGSGGQGKQGW